MCDICRNYTCPGSCPNAPAPDEFGRCLHCGQVIYDGDDYYDIDGEIWCEDCIWECRKTAEVVE